MVIVEDKVNRDRGTVLLGSSTSVTNKLPYSFMSPPQQPSGLQVIGNWDLGGRQPVYCSSPLFTLWRSGAVGRSLELSLPPGFPSAGAMGRRVSSAEEKLSASRNFTKKLFLPLFQNKAVIS